jgi:fatty acid desaturase
VRDLATLRPYGKLYNAAYLASVWGVVAGSWTLFWLHRSWWTFTIAFLVVSARQQALLNIEHECIHGTFVRGRRWNEHIATLFCASPVGSPWHASKARHLAHHRLLGDPRDPDGPLHGGDNKATRLGFLRHFALGLVGGYAVMVLLGGDGPKIEVDPKLRRRDLLDLAIAQLMLFGICTLVFAWWVYPLLWVAPLVTLTTVFHLLRSFSEHAITTAERDEHTNRLVTTTSNRIERFLVAPYWMNFHSEHHLFPWVPAQYLPEVRRRLEGHDDLPPRLTRASYLGTAVLYFRQLTQSS